MNTMNRPSPWQKLRNIYNYTVKGLEQDFTKLSMQNDQDNTTKDNNPPSLIDDPIFQHFYSKKEVDEKGFTHFEQVIKFQEPLDIMVLLDCPLFIAATKSNEPGLPLSYNQLCVDLETVRDSIEGGPDRVTEMFTFMNKLSTAHAQFVRTSSALTMLEMYEKLIFRLYDAVPDPQFHALPELQSMLFKLDFASNKMPYYEVRCSTHDFIRHLENSLTQAGAQIEALKSSVEFKLFRTHLNTAMQRHDQKVRRARLETQHAEKEALMQFTIQLAQTKEKNERESSQRTKKNLGLKGVNVDNVHQLGCQARTALPDSVIHALSIIQESYKGQIFDEGFGQDGGAKVLKAGGDEEEGEEDEENGNVVGSASDGGNGNAEGIDEEPLKGVHIPSGFEHISVPLPGTAHGG